MEWRGGRESEPKKNKKFLGRKEVRLALGPHHRALAVQCGVPGEESSHLHNSEKVGDRGRGGGPGGPVHSPPSLVSPGGGEGREARPELPPFVPARGGYLSRGLLCLLPAFALPRRRRRARATAGGPAGEGRREGGRSDRGLGAPLPAEAPWRPEEAK